MVPPTLFVSGGVAVLQLCKEVYIKFQEVKRFREDCKKLAYFVHRVEAFLMETEDEADMTQPGWQAAFAALHESLLEVGDVFNDCARFGIVRSLINADEINLRLSSIAQRLTMALQLIPIQKAKAADRRLAELTGIQAELRTTTFAVARAAEAQSAQLKRLMDQSRVDADKTQEMLGQVLLLLQQDAAARSSAAAAAAGPGPGGGTDGVAPAPAPAAAAAACLAVPVPSAQLAEEVEDLKAEMAVAKQHKKVLEEQYLAQIIAAIEQLELSRGAAAAAAADALPRAEQQQQQQQHEVPVDFICPITRELMRDPVVLDSGQTYERSAVEEWLGRGNKRDPLTGAQLGTTALVPNLLARKRIAEWLEHNPWHARQAADEAAAAARYDAALAAMLGQGGGSSSSGAGGGECGGHGGSAEPAWLQKAAAAAAAAPAKPAAAAAPSSSSSCKAAAAAGGATASCKAAAAAGATAGLMHAAGSSSSEDDGAGGLQLTAEAAAVLAAVTAAASAKRCGEVTDEKAAAQRAYASAVAATAQEQGMAATVAVCAPAAAAAASPALRRQPGSVAGKATCQQPYEDDEQRDEFSADQALQRLSSRSVVPASGAARSASAGSGGSGGTGSGQAAARAGSSNVSLDTLRATFDAIGRSRHEITRRHGSEQEQQQHLPEQLQHHHSTPSAAVSRAPPAVCASRSASWAVQSGNGRAPPPPPLDHSLSDAAAATAVLRSPGSNASLGSSGRGEEGRGGFLGSLMPRRKGRSARGGGGGEFDDAVSISSDGSGISGRSGLKDRLKGFAYTFKYDDSAC